MREGFLPWGYGDEQTHNTQCGIDKMDSSLSHILTRSLGEENMACHIGPLGNVVNKMRGRLGSIRRMGCPLVL